MVLTWIDSGVGKEDRKVARILSALLQRSMPKGCRTSHSILNFIIIPNHALGYPCGDQAKSLSLKSN